MSVVTLGETMVLFEPTHEGDKMQYAGSFRKTIGGAESNVAIGLCKLGHKSTWISKLGKDPFGKYIMNYLRGEGVNVEYVTMDSKSRTGIFFKETGSYNRTNICYYREKSAASTMQPEDIPMEIIEMADYLHISGITSALSDSCHLAVMHAIEIARNADVQVIFDPNIRQSLWGQEKYIPTLKQILKHSSYFLPGEDELELLFPGVTENDAINDILAEGVEAIIVKRGKEGASYHTKDTYKLIKGYPNEDVKDPVGAGDGFAAGFISGLLDSLSLEESINRANLVGSMVTMVRGDCEGLPNRDELNDFLNQTNDVQR